MRRQLIEAVAEYYSVDNEEAINLINLHIACAEYDELIRDLIKEGYINV